MNADRIYHILVIDDGYDTCRAIKRTLTQKNHSIETFTESTKALERFDGQSFDLVITALHIPNIGGWDIIQQVTKKNPSVKVILLTNTQMRYNESSFADFGVDYIMPKPLNPEKLRDVVTRILGSSL